MTDTLSPQLRSERMSRVRGKNTKPELAVRRLLHSLGYRYRLHRRDLPGSPDLVFATRRKVVFVHGCFWHRHADPECKLSRLPKSRLDFWLPKLNATVQRDHKAVHELKKLGWESFAVWECQIKDQSDLALRLTSFLEGNS